MNNSHIENLLAKKISGNISSDEAVILRDWLEESAENRAIFEAYQKTWNALTPLKVPAAPDAHAELKRFKKHLNHSSEQSKTNIDKITARRQSAGNSIPMYANFRNYAVAASIIFMFLCGYLVNNILFSGTIISTAYGETQTINLPDGSTVQLNASSELSYSDNFNEQDRLVHLKGEAFFAVQSSSIPFIVRTENSSIRVVGTKFNVHSRKQKTTLVVQEGKVAFASGENLNDAVILAANEMSFCERLNPPAPARNVNTEKLLGWLNGTLVFSEADIYDVAEELERTFNVHIDVDIPKYSETISGSFKGKTVENVLEAVCLVLGLNHDKKGEKYIISLPHNKN